jgi:(1->4)-alpha-D-glucan 1-alpha-D-glucosylmutase
VPRIPAATYRLQFNSRFTFRDAHRIVDYLAALGISDCYASSYLKAVPGSPHGYDVVDPTCLNPELGTEEDYSAWIAALRDRSMGHVLDVVPNHMGIAQSANPWWQDVLENGPSSRYSRFFDIEWRPVKAELADKVLLPILGDQYGAVLERQELTLTYQEGAFALRYYDEWLPIAPDTFGRILTHGLEGWLAGRPPGMDEAAADELRSIVTAAANLPPRSSGEPEAITTRAREKEVIKRRLATLVEHTPVLREFIERALHDFNGSVGQPRSFDLLDSLLNEQSYRLAHWRVASEEINYRRFFDVNQLAALRMEDPVVFEEVHRFLFELVARGAATGLRIDHVDGLFAPEDYLRRLQSRAAEIAGHGDFARPIYIVVEKILGPDEQLPGDWPVHGTTGYEFASVVNGLFVDASQERALSNIYARFVDGAERLSFDDIVYRSKKLILHETMSGDINSLGHQLNRFSERNRHFRDFTLYSLISALKEVIACFPIYRTYITASESVEEHDRRYIARAISRAKRYGPAVTGVIFDFLERLLLKQTGAATEEECDERARFIGKFQQITAPIAAKGIEDTALYIYNRLLSLNDVGSDPTRFGHEPATVHQWMADRRCHWPAALSATATHDTKRGEDVRARLNVLSEVPDAWRTAVRKWRAVNRRFKREIRGVLVPDSNEEYFLYQTLLGTWPFEDSAGPPFAKRIKRYMVKALREAKVHTGWLSPDEEYEAAVLGFIDAILDPRRLFLAQFTPFQRRIAELGIYNSLAQLVIKIAAPGVPDFYQGTELWDLSLVDPDNRLEVDYDLRRRRLEEVARDDDPDLVANLLDNRADGRIKMFTMVRGLNARAARRTVFENGTYVPLASRGDRRECVFAFMRRHQDRLAIACVPRLIAKLAADAVPPLGRAAWPDTRIELPESIGPCVLRDVFTGAATFVGHNEAGFSLDVANIFGRFPVALLVSTEAAN